MKDKQLKSSSCQCLALGVGHAVAYQNFRRTKKIEDQKREKEPLQHFKGIMLRQQTLQKEEVVGVALLDGR